ncbi:MAG: hypothetical protein K0S78_4370, partial [Thermomicrobiales bacterium]|nr:hypothetical protein [Thermomicrobiales bacterium]
MSGRRLIPKSIVVPATDRALTTSSFRAYLPHPTPRIQEGVHATSTRTIATVTGVLFLITFITSIPAAFYFYPPVLNDPTYIVGAGADMRVKFG